MQCPQCNGTGQVRGTLGMKLLMFKARKKKTSKEVCDEVGISASSLNSLERDAAKNPSLQMVMALAKYYNTTIDDLVQEEEANGG